MFLEDGYSKVVVYYVLYNAKKQQCIGKQIPRQINDAQLEVNIIFYDAT